MKLSLFVAALCLIQLTAAVTIEIKRAQSQVHLASEAAADEWGYGQNGADWAGLCASGKAQSPINVDMDKARCVKAGDSGWKNYALQFRYQRANNLTMQHDGHALIVPTTATSSLGYVISGCAECSNSRYSVKQFQFHAPSEHTINGRQYDAELQIQHQRDGATDNNDLLNVAILFYVNPNGTGLPHRFLNNIEWYASPSAAGQTHAINGCVDLNLFKQEVFEHDYYAYQGSRTTPGCEESVAWRVMATPQGVTQLQLDVLANLFAKNSAFAAGKGNNRKVQDLNGREVVLYKRYGGVF